MSQTASEVQVQKVSAQETAQLLIEALDLEDITAAEMDPDEALFGDGLGLDSIDALEIAMAISQKYGVEMKAEDETTREAFANINSLCAFIEQNR